VPLPPPRTIALLQQRALLWLRPLTAPTRAGLKHYFLVRFPQRPGALKEFVTNVLPPSASIVRFEYLQRTNAESGPALVGLEVDAKERRAEILQNFARYNVDAEEVRDDSLLLRFLL
jgi:threonine dehydratase